MIDRRQSCSFPRNIIDHYLQHAVSLSARWRDNISHSKRTHPVERKKSDNRSQQQAKQHMKIKILPTFIVFGKNIFTCSAFLLLLLALRRNIAKYRPRIPKQIVIRDLRGFFCLFGYIFLGCFRFRFFRREKVVIGVLEGNKKDLLSVREKVQWSTKLLILPRINKIISERDKSGREQLDSSFLAQCLSRVDITRKLAPRRSFDKNPIIKVQFWNNKKYWT